MLEGDWHATRLVVLESPTSEAAKRWYASPEYTKVKPLRHQRAVSRLVFVEGA